MLSKENVQDIYGLSPMQQGMLLQFALDPASGSYFEQFDFALHGTVQLQALQSALYSLTAKYDVLRTIFSFRKTDVPRQIVLKHRAPEKMEIRHMDLRAGSEAQTGLEEFKRADRAQAFDLSQDVLLRLTLVSLPCARQHLIFSFHHIILDGWCMGLLLGDLFAYYEHYCSFTDQPILEREQHPYRDYIRWIEQQDGSKAQEYWSQALQGYQNEVGAPYFDLKGKNTQAELESADHEFSLGLELTAQLQQLAREAHITLNCIFQTAWGVLLQKYNNVDDVAFGCVIAGRPPALPGVEKMIGLFLNTQPLRVVSQADDTLLSLAKRVQQSLFAAAAYDYYPLSAVQSISALKNRLLSHTVTFENMPIGEQLGRLNVAGCGLQVGEVRVFQAAKYDFHVVVNPGQDLRVNLVHNPRHYHRDAVASIERSLVQILQAFAVAPQQLVQQLSICAAPDRERLLHGLNPPPQAYPRHDSVTSLFLQTMQAQPDAVALVYRGEELTYRNLHAQAQMHAQRLRELGVQPGDCVALQVRRGAAMLVGVLAIYYCGASYLPLEDQLSGERLRFILQDGAAKLLCTSRDLLARVQDCGVALHFLDQELPACPELQPVCAAAESAAYLMYTSGSTGQPKGCRVSHRNIVRLVRNTNFLQCGPQTRVLQTGSNAFDASTFEFWGPLLNGGQLYVVDEEQILDPKLLRQALREQHITTIWLTAALFNQLADADPAMFGTLQHLLVGGDALSPSHVEKVREANPQLRLINGYGPTENTTFSTTFEIQRAYPDGVPIGKPIAHSTCYVLDAAGQLLPPGAFGELCVGGDGVADGYVGRYELTAEKFLPDPFCPGGRMYRTGDIARWLPDGNLDLRGRNDFQIKLRGFRVELGEIERALCKQDGIREAVVVVHEGPGGKQLHAFYVGQRVWGAGALRAALAASLPSYMVPTYYLHLERMPLTVNGKLDRRALPLEDSLKQTSSQVLVLARNQTESRIAEVCQQVLGLTQIGIHDNFFDIGANSLNLIAINNRLRDLFEREIPLTALFEYTSIGRLAEYLEQDQAALQARQQAEAQELEQAQDALRKTRRLKRAMDTDDCSNAFECEENNI